MKRWIETESKLGEKTRNSSAIFSCLKLSYNRFEHENNGQSIKCNLEFPISFLHKSLWIFTVETDLTLCSCKIN